MAFSCGCKVSAGAPIPIETIREHYKHTMEAILFWELLRRPDTPQGDDNMKLSQARIDLLEAIDKLYPEASKEGP